MNKLKKGLTYISERGSFYRYSDKNQEEKWLKPLSEYIPLEEIKRGQPVSIATPEDIELAAAKISAAYNAGKSDEESVSKDEIYNVLLSDSNTFVVLTNPIRHKNTIGLSYEYTPAPVFNGETVELCDKIHILDSGKFDIDPDYLLKSYQIDSAETLLTEVINVTEYVPDFFKLNYKDIIGKQIYVKGTIGGSNAGELTIEKEDAYIGYNNIIKVGFISDAWLNGSRISDLKEILSKDPASLTQAEKKTLESLDWDSDNPEEFINNSVTIQVQIQGDDRGALDSTLFEGILGEDVIIPSSDPIRVFAYGQEDDVKFSARINITPNNTLNLDKINFDKSTEFIGFQKMDGKTALVTFDDKFDIAKAKDTGVSEDNAFLAIAEVYDPEFRTNSRIFKADYNVENVSPLGVESAINSLKEALNEAWSSIFDSDDEADCGLDFEQFIPTENGQSGYIKLTAKKAGGYYYMYISDRLKSYFMIDSFTITNGSSDNKNYVVLADNRISSRQNIIGIYNSGDYDVVLKKGTKCVFMHDGLFKYNNHPYTVFEDKSTIGCEYFLSRNGSIRRFADTAYDTVVKVLDVQDEDKLVIHCDNARVRTRGGDLPLGYMKPAVRIGDKFAAEYGFVLMDGETRYSYKAYEALYKRLTGLYPTSRLNLGIVAGDTEETFVIPKCTTITDDTLSPSIVQIKAVEYGIYEKEPRIPYIRNFGNFESSSSNKEITIDGHTYLTGIAIPTIGKYTVVSNKGTKEETTENIDTRFDITPICDLTIMENGVEEPTIENLDIHLYVDPEYDIAHSALYHWVELRTGFQNFNNNTTYGFEWKIEKEEPNKDNPFGRYFLSTDIKNGMGLYYQTSTNVVPTPLSGMPWKITVSRRENVAQQYDLNGVMHAYLSSRAEDEKGNPFTTKAVTGEAVIHAIENHYRVRNLEAYPDVEGDPDQKSHIYLGKENAPATAVSLSSVEQIPVYSPNGIKFETSLKIGNKEDQKVVFKNNWFEVIPGTDELGKPIDIKSYNQLSDNQFTTKAQVQEHLDKDATKCVFNNKDTDGISVHGMIFGAKGNIDASLLNSLPLGTHHQARIIAGKSDTIVNSEDRPSYLGYNYYGTDPINNNSTYISNQEGTIIHNRVNIDKSDTSNGVKGVFSTSAYSENISQSKDDELFYEETINSNYKVFHNQVHATDSNKATRTLEIKYNFNVNSTEADSASKTDTGVYDIEFNKIIGNTTTPASIKVGNIGITSKAEFKRIYGESFNAYNNPITLDLTDPGVFTNNEDSKDFFGSALQAVYEVPTACWQYKNEPNWYKKYMGIVIDRVNDIRDKLSTENYRNIFTKEDQTYWADSDNTGSTKPFNATDNRYSYSDDEIKSIKSYLNAITDNAESAQNIISSVGLLFQAAKETQERLLKVEASTFGADAPTIPGHPAKIYFPETPDVTPEATHLGLNRLIRAMAIELYGTANPDDGQLNDINESNNTSTTLSRLDELEAELEGKTFDKGVKTDAADNVLTANSATYPYEVNEETSHGGITKYDNIGKDVYLPITQDEETKVLTYHSQLHDTTLEVKPEDTVYYKNKNDVDNDYIVYDDDRVDIAIPEDGEELYIKESYVDVLGNQNPIDGRSPVDDETEDSENHGTWTKVNFSKDARFEQKDGEFITDTDHNIVPEDNRYNFNGTIDAISRICTKVNALTYTINGKDNINSTPERLNTIRNNIETLIKEAYFDGAPETTVTPATETSVASATTEDRNISQAYIDEDLDHTDEDRTLFPQPSQPYELKKAKGGNGKDYTGLSRFDQLSKDLYDYVITGFDTSKNTVFTNVNSEDNGADLTDKKHTAIQYTSADDVANKGASKKQVLVGRTFNGKQLLIDGESTSDGIDVTRLDQTHSDETLPKSFHINVPDSIEEYQYASIIDILIDAIGKGHFRYQIKKDENTTHEELRPTKTITDRIEAIENALDNVVHKLSQNEFFEEDTEKLFDDSDLFEGSDSNSTYSIESFITHLNKWLGLSTQITTTTWDQSTTAEIACGYVKSNTTDPITRYFPVTGNEYVDENNNFVKVEPDETYYVVDNTTKNYVEYDEKSHSGFTRFVKREITYPLEYLDNANPIVNSNYVIKQLLKRIHKEESYRDALIEILGEDYKLENAGSQITTEIDDVTGIQKTVGKADYNLTDDIKDLLLTIYGTDDSSLITRYQHRSNIETNDFGSSKCWKAGDGKTVFTSEVVENGYKAYTTPVLSEVLGTITDYSEASITVGGTIYNRFIEGDYKESEANTNTRFTGNAEARNIIDDIVKESYYVPNPVKFTEKAKNEIVDSKNVKYNETQTYYDFDSGEYHYDYEHKAGDESGGAVGKAIGYNNRDSLFNDYKDTGADYRRSRFQVLEDEIRHLRSFLGLNKIMDDTIIDKSEAAKTVYGGHFYGTSDTALAGHKFSGDATRNGNFFATQNAATDTTAEADSNLLTMVFNLSNALRDISRELGTETQVRGVEYENFSQLNKERDYPIYERLRMLEDQLGSLLGIVNNDPNKEADNEDDYEDGTINIQWIEE